MLDNIRVVLVNTSHPGNIGGAARAMKNMGLSHLVLVEPTDFPSAKATARASGAVGVLKDAIVVSSLEDALEGCHLAFGASARDRHIAWPVVDPRECSDMVVQQALKGAHVALVFGREHSGLTNEELQLCHYHVHIPSVSDFSSLNLAAAVQVIVYEIRMKWLALHHQSTRFPITDGPDLSTELPLTVTEMESFYAHLEKMLVHIKFLDPNTPRQLMSRLRRLYGRTNLDRQEMNILRGILTETIKSADDASCLSEKTNV